MPRDSIGMQKMLQLQELCFSCLVSEKACLTASEGSQWVDGRRGLWERQQGGIVSAVVCAAVRTLKHPCD